MQVTINKIHKSDKNKEGKPFVTKDGRPYTRLAIQTQEHGTKWLSGFDNKMTQYWKEGDKVEVEVTENGEYLNFKTLSQTDRLWTAYNELLKRVIKLEQSHHQDYSEAQVGHVEDINGEIMASREEDLPF